MNDETGGCVQDVLAKLKAAQESASAVPKKGRNQKQNYDFVRAEDVIHAARKALHEAGLVASMSYGEAEVRDITSQRGGAGMFVRIPCTLRIADPDSGEEWNVNGAGAGTDYPGDKAIYKAMTGAAKYAYASALAIPFGDDPEKADEHAPDESAPKTIGADIAKKMVERIWKVPAAKDRLQLAVAHAAERDVGDCTTKPKAIEALATLSYSQAEKLDTWVERKESEDA